MRFPENQIQDHHRVSVLWALIHCFLSGATQQFCDDACNLSLSAIRRHPLLDLIDIALKWLYNRPSRDEKFLKDLLELSEGSVRGVGAAAEAR